jgi:hypothetical protein
VCYSVQQDGTIVKHLFNLQISEETAVVARQRAAGLVSGIKQSFILRGLIANFPPGGTSLGFQRLSDLSPDPTELRSSNLA